MKNKYFEKSKKAKLPMRCPIIGKCERYAQTIFHLSELGIYSKGKTIEAILRDENYLPLDYENEKVNQIGEPFKFSKSENTCDIRKACPEVSLFDNKTVFSFIPVKPVVSGFWDNFWKNDEFGEDKKFKIYETGHYCECPEFSKYHYENKIGTVRKRATRKRMPISKKLRFEILQRDKFKCQYCKRSKDEDGVKLQIDHVIPISEGGTDEIKNLVTSCEDCNQGKSNKII